MPARRRCCAPHAINLLDTFTEMPDVQRRMAAMGQNLDFRNSDEYRERLASDHQKFGAIIRAAGIEPN